ncbi:MAG TPA: ATP-binding protein [Polyangiales bacterium]|nr:ATP-binding protein [Polyangiales bacterium]
MVRLIRQSKEPSLARDDRTWALLPSALWDLDFTGPLAWIEAQGCADADEFKRLVRNDPGALSECLNRLRIDRVSAGAVSLVGAASEEECVRRSSELLTAESKADFLRVLMAAFRGEQDVHLETAIVTCSREPRDVRVHWRFVPNDEGRFERAIVSVVDMTAERDLQQRLLLAERMSAIGTLTASIIHEIKNPLTFVWNHLRSLQESSEPTGETAAELVREAFEGAERIRLISNEITSLSHGGTGAEIEAVHVQQVLDSALRMAQPEIQHRAAVVREYEEGSLYVRGSRTRISQVFLNLIVNAAQAIDPGERAQNTITLRVRSTGESVYVEVQDTGPGIPPQLLRRIFDPFVTTKPAGRGTGLGLSICRRIVHSLEGTIELQSHPGQGTVARVVLPKATRAQRPLTVPPTSMSAIRRAAGGKLKVLVVDDEPVIARLIQKALVDHDVTTANDGREAVALMQENAYDVILCDLIMPEMTGMDVYRAALQRANPLHDRIVFMTGGAFTQRARDFLQSVPNLRIEKPFELTHLERIIYEAADLVEPK